jgi:hypothetical protein
MELVGVLGDEENQTTLAFQLDERPVAGVGLGVPDR